MSFEKKCKWPRIRTKEQIINAGTVDKTSWAPQTALIINIRDVCDSTGKDTEKIYEEVASNGKCGYEKRLDACAL